MELEFYYKYFSTSKPKIGDVVQYCGDSTEISNNATGNEDLRVIVSVTYIASNGSYRIFMVPIKEFSWIRVRSSETVVYKYSGWSKDYAFIRTIPEEQLMITNII